MGPKRDYSSSVHYDRRLYRQDIAGSIAHVRMLARQEIVEADDAESIVAGLEAVRDEIEGGTFPWREELEDIHMNIESRLFDKIGVVAGKLHTARSRNDQVALDMRMYARDEASGVIAGIDRLRTVIVDQAEANAAVVMPGYTHLQRAQPVLFAHHMLAYFEMLGRDRRRFIAAREAADVLPLGSGALAGVPYPIDRESVARDLGFGSISANSMDAVSDRDFLFDFQSAAAVCMVHLSRLADELVLWSSDEFGFVRLSDDHTTGSSMMPQKRNPDFAELARGKAGRVFGHLVGLLTVLKGLPLTYNRDLQEDKEAFFDTVDTLTPTLDVMTGMVASMSVDTGRMRDAAGDSRLLATDLADYLVKRGMPFREAHGVVAKLSTHSLDSGQPLDRLPLEVYRSFSELFDEDVLSIGADTSTRARDVPGGTAPGRVRAALSKARASLERPDA